MEAIINFKEPQTQFTLKPCVKLELSLMNQKTTRKEFNSLNPEEPIVRPICKLYNKPFDKREHEIKILERKLENLKLL